MQRMLAKRAVAALLVVGAATTASAVVPAGEFYACLKKDGKVAEMSVNVVPTCKKDETLVQWNQMGPPGDPGLPGSAGAQGEQGPPGLSGFEKRTVTYTNEVAGGPAQGIFGWSVSCPSGKKAISGGFKAPFAHATEIYLVDSYPSSEGTWRVDVRTEVASEVITFEVWVHCANVADS